MRRLVVAIVVLAALMPALEADEPATMPDAVHAVLAARCLDCHTGDAAEAGVRLDARSIDWASADQVGLWSRVVEVIENRRMPPPDAEQATPAERNAIVAFLDPPLVAHTSFGGTPPRRLNKAEYETTIRKLLKLPSFHLPVGFPPDTERHGFDNLAEGLVLSPAHLEAYAAVARDVADEIFPPPRPTATSARWEAGPHDLVLSFSAATIHGDALRLVSRSVDIMRSCTWPSRIEVKDSGTYTVTVEASQFLSPEGHAFTGPMKLEVYARPVSATDRSRVDAFRLLHTIDVTAESPATTSFEADLYEGDTVLFRWANAEMTHEFEELADQMEAWFRDDPRFLAAWQQAVFVGGYPGRPETTRLRGRNGWDIVSKHWSDPALDMSQATMDSKQTKRLLELWRSMASTTAMADGLCHFYHERGPALEIHRVAIEGPSKSVESPRDKSRAAARQALVGARRDGQTDADLMRSMLVRFLPQAFRRPVDDETVERFLTIGTRHLDEGHSFDEAVHLVLRSVLVSPRFLYRDLEPENDRETLDQFDLATRLSYFLTQGPPDTTLVDLATRNRLGESWVLRREATRLMPDRAATPMICSFVGQWLDTKLLPGIMPDPKFNFDDEAVGLARQETETFFAEILRKNLPMTTFIDPDFTFSTIAFCERNYRFTPPDVKDRKTPLTPEEMTRFQRLAIDRGGRYGGLLGQAAILMATANGVDTQPVIRGAWVLENILGMPSPPPPKNVPALTPDTRGAKTPRELLAAHTQESSCALCHARIDPVGFVLENYDPVGRWREKWPGTEAAIDPSGTLPDGTAVKDPAEFKAWLVANIDIFSTCLAEKLMTYATGRVPNYAEQREIEKIVKANREAGQGFKDLVLDLIDSRTFRAR
jgi:mono/diheme cytochrome c family protein